MSSLTPTLHLSLLLIGISTLLNVKRLYIVRIGGMYPGAGKLASGKMQEKIHLCGEILWTTSFMPLSMFSVRTRMGFITSVGMQSIGNRRLGRALHTQTSSNTRMVLRRLWHAGNGHT